MCHCFTKNMVKDTKRMLKLVCLKKLTTPWQNTKKDEKNKQVHKTLHPPK